MGEGREVDPNIGYDRGSRYERGDFWRANDDILGAHGLESIYTPFRPPEKKLPPKSMERLADLIRNREDGHSLWGVKDPRFCLTYPLWRPILPEHKIVGVYRSLYSLASRYRVNGKPLRAYRLVSAWHEHNIGLVNAVEGSKAPAIIVRYESMMENDVELRRLSEFLGMPLVDCRRQEMRRSTEMRGLTIRVAEFAYKMRTGRTTGATIDSLERNRAI